MLQFDQRCPFSSRAIELAVMTDDDKNLLNAALIGYEIQIAQLRTHVAEIQQRLWAAGKAISGDAVCRSAGSFCCGPAENRGSPEEALAALKKQLREHM